MRFFTPKSLYMFTFSISILAIFSAMAAIPNDEKIGNVSHVEGSAAAIQDAQFRKLEEKSPIFMHDVISTGKASKVKVRLPDGTQMTLGAKTSLVVEEYFLRNENGAAIARLLSGSMRMISGKIAKISPAHYKLKTGVATIGVRGTEFITYTEGAKRKFLLLEGEAITLENHVGTFEVSTKCQLYSMADDRSHATNEGLIRSADAKRALANTFTKEDFKSQVKAVLAAVTPAPSSKPKVLFRSRPKIGAKKRPKNRFATQDGRALCH